MDIGLRLLHPMGTHERSAGRSPRPSAQRSARLAPKVRSRPVSGWIGGMELAGGPAHWEQVSFEG
jgi:hypothetical protein